jgi:putative oxidoreductase
MSLSRVVARPLLASMFISGGLDSVRHPETKVAAAQGVTDQLRTVVPSLPKDTASLVRFNGAVQVGAGVMLAVGRARRLAALALIGSILPTTYAGHRFWEESDPGVRAQQRVHFLKNLGLLGGLILALVDTEGAPSLAWRTRQSAQRVSHTVALGRTSTGSSAHRASEKAAAASRRGRRKAKKAAQQAAVQASTAARRGGRRANRLASNAASSGLALSGSSLRHVNESAHHAARAALASAEHSAHTVSEKSADTRHNVSRKARKAALQANKAAHQANTATKRGGHRANRALADAAASGVAIAVPHIRQANESARTVAKALREGAEPALTALREGADPLLAAGAEKAEVLRDKVSEHLGS